MKKLLRNSLMGVIFGVLIFGCNQQKDNLIPSANQGVSMKDGRIVFGSLDDFKNTIDELKKMKEDERSIWQRKMGHSSMMDFYNNNEGIIVGTKNPVYKTRETEKPYIPDNMFARIVNSEGIFQLGNKVHQITSEGLELVVDEKNVSSLSKKNRDSSIESHKISVSLEEVNPQLKNARTGEDFPIAGYDFRDGRVAFALFARSNYWWYNSFAMKLQVSERRGWWIFQSWQPINATYLEITNAGFSFQEPFQPFYGGGSGSCNECSEAYAFLGEVYGPVTFTSNWTIGGNFKVTYNGQTVTFSR